MNKPERDAAITIPQSIGLRIGTVSNNPMLVPGNIMKGKATVIAADAITANNKNLFEKKPTMNALRLSDRQFHTTNSSCKVARIKAIVLAYSIGCPSM